MWRFLLFQTYSIFLSRLNKAALWNKLTIGGYLKKRLVQGVGVNDTGGTVSWFDEKGKQKHCPYYAVWVHMLERCYSKHHKDKYPTYKDVTCCEEWLTFSNFKSWMEQQDWKGKHLDKDLLVYKNKVYSPEACVFLEPNLNSMLSSHLKSSKKLPAGVHYTAPSKHMCNERSKPYRSEIRIDNKRQYLPYHANALSAHRDWQLKKAEVFIELSKAYSKEEKVSKGLLRIANQILSDYTNCIETKYF